jgi:hypothetical protein
MYDVESVAEELLGTKQPLGDVVGTHLVDDWSFGEELRSHAIRCHTCKTWYDPEEVDAEDICEGCSDA